MNCSWSVVAYEELEYDPNGNLVQDGSFYYEFDGWNRLRRVRENDSSGRLLAEYAYDPAGQRIKKVVYYTDGSNETTLYVGDFVRVINSSGTFDTKYVRDDKGTLLAVIDPQNKTFYYHPDHLGSTQLVTNESGEVVEKTEYMPFGAAITGGNDRYTYTGQENDPETELMYYGARYYSPYLHRFTQPDTILQDVYDPQLLNRYTYVKNNPVKNTDPSGHFLPAALILPFFLVIAVGFVGYVTYVGTSPSVESIQSRGPVSFVASGTSAAIGAAVELSIAPPIKTVGAVTQWAGITTEEAIAAGAAGSTVTQVVQNVAEGETIVKNTVNAFVSGGVSGALVESTSLGGKAGQFAPTTALGCILSKTGILEILAQISQELISEEMKSSMDEAEKNKIVKTNEDKKHKGNGE